MEFCCVGYDNAACHCIKPMPQHQQILIDTLSKMEFISQQKLILIIEALNICCIIEYSPNIALIQIYLVYVDKEVEIIPN